jgi:pyruvate/2-oxoacid:ferredoxin oxidoreductase alpha subunit
MPVIDDTTTAPCKRVHADPRAVLTGTHFINGDAAACEGALAAGARFAAGYPITPSTEIVERFAARAPQVGGLFIQMEDELAASITLQGMVWAGQKSFTVTSGPGFSLMMEHIGIRGDDRDAVRLHERATRGTIDGAADAAGAGAT